MKLVSWNVNGLRACLGKGFLDFCAQADADIICLQETKMRPEQAQFDLPGYTRFWNSADKAGYSGTAVFTREEPLAVTYDYGGVSGILSGVLLYPQLPGGTQAAGLPHDLGGRPAGVSSGAGCP